MKNAHKTLYKPTEPPCFTESSVFLILFQITQFSPDSYLCAEGECKNETDLMSYLENSDICLPITVCILDLNLLYSTLIYQRHQWASWLQFSTSLVLPASEMQEFARDSFIRKVWFANGLTQHSPGTLFFMSWYHYICKFSESFKVWIKLCSMFRNQHLSV